MSVSPVHHEAQNLFGFIGSQLEKNLPQDELCLDSLIGDLDLDKI